jgi:hypothetical protein
VWNALELGVGREAFFLSFFGGYKVWEVVKRRMGGPCDKNFGLGELCTREMEVGSLVNLFESGFLGLTAAQNLCGDMGSV